MSFVICTQTGVHVVYFKILTISILKIIHCDLVTLCHGFCISYGIAHVLNDYSLFQVPHVKAINTAIFWPLAPLHSVFH